MDTKAQRAGRIYIDYLRNGRGATSVCAHSPRARPEAGVSTPLTWDELSVSLSAAQFSLNNIESRLAHLRKDPWSGFAELRQGLPQTRSRR